MPRDGIACDRDTLAAPFDLAAADACVALAHEGLRSCPRSPRRCRTSRSQGSHLGDWLGKMAILAQSMVAWPGMQSRLSSPAEPLCLPETVQWKDKGSGGSASGPFSCLRPSTSGRASRRCPKDMPHSSKRACRRGRNEEPSSREDLTDAHRRELQARKIEGIGKYFPHMIKWRCRLVYQSGMRRRQRGHRSPHESVRCRAACARDS